MKSKRKLGPTNKNLHLIYDDTGDQISYGNNSLTDLLIQAGITDEIKKEEEEEINPLWAKLRSLPFWCYDDTLHKRIKNYNQEYCCITHIVGLPRTSDTNEELPLTPYQIEFY